MNEFEFDRIVITSDLYKVDDRAKDKLPNPQSINIEWIYALFAPILKDTASCDVLPLIQFDYPDPLARLSVYRYLYRDFSSQGWASFYDDFDDDLISGRLAERLKGSLVIGFELPPNLGKVCLAHDIPFIDLTIHPVRFLPDYIFGVRSNIASVSRRAFELAIPPRLFYDFARISAARTARVYRNNRPEPGSAIFFGQISIDSSLIFDGRLATDEDVDNAIYDLLSRYRTVYYKNHPHANNIADTKKRMERFGRVRWIEANAYDLMAVPGVAEIASLSSGSLIEAKYFGARPRRYLPERRLISEETDAWPRVFQDCLYVPVGPVIFFHDYWRYLLGLTESRPPAPSFDPSQGALKHTLNMRWGR